MTSGTRRLSGRNCCGCCVRSLDLPSLALPADELEVALNATAQRADEAERNMSAALLNEANAVRENRQLQLDMAKARERIAQLEAENARLSNLNQSGAVCDRRGAGDFARGCIAGAGVCATGRACGRACGGGGGVVSGRDRVERRALFGRDAQWAAAWPWRDDVRAWPVCCGGLSRRVCRREACGPTVLAVADEGLVWSGQWDADEACGFGILEAPDGRRFEGA